MRKPACVVWLLALALLEVGACAQELSLGDVARESKARAAASQQKILTNDDLGSKAGFFRMYDWSYLTIPQVRVSFLAPVSKEGPVYGSGLYVYPVAPQQNVVFVLGPYVKSEECSEDLDCAEAHVLGQELPKRFELRNVEKLFQTSTEIDGQTARITNFSAINIGGRQRGVLVLVVAPAQIVTASCIYPKASFDPADSLCRTAIGSVELNIPEHYRRWGGSGEWER